jgi:hypothetical protein
LESTKEEIIDSKANQSAVRALADASEITGLPRDNFEVWEISKEEFQKSRSAYASAGAKMV